MVTHNSDPTGNRGFGKSGVARVVALIQVVFPPLLLAVFRVSAWLAVALGSIGTVVAVLARCRPGIAGKLKLGDIGALPRKTFQQMWGALLVDFFIFGLAYVFNYSGTVSSLSKGFSYQGVRFIVVAPVLRFIGVALSGSRPPWRQPR